MFARRIISVSLAYGQSARRTSILLSSAEIARRALFLGNTARARCDLRERYDGIRDSRGVDLPRAEARLSTSFLPGDFVPIMATMSPVAVLIELTICIVPPQSVTRVCLSLEKERKGDDREREKEGTSMPTMFRDLVYTRFLTAAHGGPRAMQINCHRRPF